MAAKQGSPIDQFISRWEAAGGSERANYQLFLTELCELLALPKPDPAAEDTRDNAYVFERKVHFTDGDGSVTNNFIDLYRRGSFVCEAKKIKGKSEAGFDKALAAARGQAEQYARALPAKEGRPPFLIVVDVGSVIELYSEFTRSGATYTPFPDPRSYRIRLEDLRNEEIRDRLKKVWLDPIALDPTRQSAKVTREIAAQIALIAKSLESGGYGAEQVAGFLSRCLFTFFAEDIGLLPKRAFSDLLESLADKPAQFIPMVSELWKAMDTGEFSAAIREKVLRFNGKLFKSPDVLPLNRDQIGLMIEAARADWRQVEPAIFGTLLERALDPEERHALGAHYTPRAYVERLVLPTVIEPLREDWRIAQTAALTEASEGNMKAARQRVRDFQKQLCAVRVLDPACGSGNFLYVTLEHLKRLEGEVINLLEELGDKQGLLELAGITVDPHQFLGLEINPRAAAIAEMVLWIGYLQWHYRTRGQVTPPIPVLRDFHNIEHRDALIAYDRAEPMRDEQGKVVTRWDGKSFKKHATTGEDVPDEMKRIAVEKYVNPRKAEWPQAEFIVGNPPFIGDKRLRQSVGDGYVDALRSVWKSVPESADFVMHWWEHAAELARNGDVRRFGFITTNSLRQTFNRRVLEQHLDAKPALALNFAIPDHPWVDAADGAAVRIAMTVASAGQHSGVLNEVIDERETDGDAADITLRPHRGVIHADLRVGANVASASELRANERISSMGMMRAGAGFVVSRETAVELGLGRIEGIDKHLCQYRSGKDLTDGSKDQFIIDLFGLTAQEARARFPTLYQRVFERVKPERDQNNRARLKEEWWIFAEPRKILRSGLVGLTRYIATPETSKHRVFQFLEHGITPDHRLVCIAHDDGLILGVLSSSTHIIWALAAGGTLEDRPVYNKSRCFEPFPFPVATPTQAAAIRKLAEAIDAHRKTQQVRHPELILTGLYNAIEKLKTGEPLAAKEKQAHEQGLAAVLKQLHDELDLAVLDAYGWSDLAPLMQVVNGNDRSRPRDDAKRQLDETLLERLVTLNAERAAEEANGTIRWLRPDFQNPKGKAAKPEPVQQQMALEVDEPAAKKPSRKRDTPIPWPKELPEQVKAVSEVLRAAGSPLTESNIAAQFTGRGPWKKRLPQILETLVTMGRARKAGSRYQPA